MRERDVQGVLHIGEGSARLAEVGFGHAKREVVGVVLVEI